MSAVGVIAGYRGYRLWGVVRYRHCSIRPLLMALACSMLLLGALCLHSYETVYVGWMIRTQRHPDMSLSAQTETTVSCDAACIWLREQQRRREHLTARCNAYRHSSKKRGLSLTLTPARLKQMNHLLVLDSHKLIYCYLPKVGCTNWKRIFLVLSGSVNEENATSQFDTHVRARKDIRTLARYPLDEAKARLANYTKFMFVRHPFERLISGYRDKFLMDYPSSTIFRQKYGRKIASYDGGAGRAGRAAPRRQDGTLNVSFGQFVRYVGDVDNRFRGDDPTEHWNAMHRMCHPCAVDYDVLGNFSSLRVDAEFLLRSEGLDDVVSYPSSTNPTNSSDEAYMNGYFENIPGADIEALVTRYAIDFDLFGYKIPSSIQAKLRKAHFNKTLK